MSRGIVATLVVAGILALGGCASTPAVDTSDEIDKQILEELTAQREREELVRKWDDCVDDFNPDVHREDFIEGYCEAKLGAKP